VDRNNFGWLLKIKFMEDIKRINGFEDEKIRFNLMAKFLFLEDLIHIYSFILPLWFILNL